MSVKVVETYDKSEFGCTVKVKKIKDSYFKDTYFTTRSISSLAKSEKNDCVVRAFMVALDVTYEQAHSWVSNKFYRRDRQGTYTSQYLKNVIGAVKNGKKISIFGFSPSMSYHDLANSKNLLVNTKYAKQTSYTVQSFMEEYPKGRYVIFVKGHALSLIDGVLYANASEQHNGFRRRINYVLKIS
jgi:hypothetical protein